MLMALTAVPVMAVRACPSRHVTTATALASLRKASFVCAASWSFRGAAACMRHLPWRRFLLLTLYRTVRYTVLYVTVMLCCNRKILGLDPYDASVGKSYVNSR